MKRLLSGLSLIGVAAFFTGFSSSIYADAVACGTLLNDPQNGGTSIAVRAGSYGGSCYQNNEYDNNFVSSNASSTGVDSVNHYIDGDLIDLNTSARSSGSASRSGFTLSGSVYTFDGHSNPGAFVTAIADDTWTLTVDENNLGVKTINFKGCSRFNSSNNNSWSNNVDFTVLTSLAGAFSLQTGALSHVYSDSGSQCFDAELTYDFSEPTIFTITSTANLHLSGLGNEIFPNMYPKVSVFEGQLAGSLSIDASGFSCVSTSGDAAGCELPPIDPEEEIDKIFPKPERNVDDCFEVAGNPINFVYGYKVQNETDYAGQVLSFSRTYRSDKSWTNDYIGDRWHHNYDRKLTFGISGGNNTAELVNESGRVVYFYDDGNGWKTEYSDDTETFNSDGNGGYVYTDNTETKETYNGSGQLIRIEYVGRDAVNLFYTGGLLTSVEDEYGNALSFTYNSYDKIETLTTPGNNVFTYAYDGENLTSVTKPDNMVRTYHYEDIRYFNALTGITDENGNRYATYGYDDDGKAIFTEHFSGAERYDVSYDPANQSVTVTNPLGKDTIYTYKTINGLRKIENVEGVATTNCSAGNKSYTYTDEGWLKSKTDWEKNDTTYNYDSEGRIIEVIRDDGSDIDISYVSGKRLYDVITLDDLEIDFDYDSFDRVTSVTRKEISTSDSRVTSYSYYVNTTGGNGKIILGKLSTINGPRPIADTVTYEYDSSGRMYKVTNALGHIMEVTQFDNDNRPLNIADPNGLVTTLSYDSLGRVLSFTKDDNNGLVASTNLSYDDNGNVLTVTQVGATTINGNPVDNVLTYAYDESNRIEQVTDTIGNSISYVRDVAGNITSETYKNQYQTVKFSQSNVFDDLSRLLQVTRGNVIDKFEYDLNDNLTKYTDGLLNSETYTYNGLQRLVNLRQSGDVSVGTNLDTGFAYNEYGDNTSVTDARGANTVYQYNAFGDVVEEDSPDRGVITYTHDKAGNVTSRTDVKNGTVNYQYDVLNRLTSITYLSDTSLNTTFLYDEDGDNNASTNNCGAAIGNLCRVSDITGFTYYYYDSFGRVVQKINDRGNNFIFTTGYSYYPHGALYGIVLPSTNVILYGRDEVGNVDYVLTGAAPNYTYIANNIEYMPFGGIESLTYGNSITLTNTYNQAYQLTGKQHGTLSNMSYTYDNAGRMIGKGSTSYEYNALYHLTKETSGSSKNYTYDAVGNRLSDDIFSFLYDPLSSVLASITEGSTTTIVSVTGGYLDNDITRSYTFNAAGQLSSVDKNGTFAAAYYYDSRNLRTKKITATDTTHYIYGADGLLYGEYDQYGQLIKEYIYLNGEPLAQFEGNGDITYLHTDHLGTPRKATNASGSEVWNWDSDAFGNGTPSGSAKVNLRMAGQYYDDESGLHYNWNRYYDPETGRYISSDPIGLNGGLNTFVYTGANPVMYIDPEGLYYVSCKPDDLICLAKKRADRDKEQRKNTGRKACPDYQRDIKSANGWRDANNTFHCGFDVYKEDHEASPNDRTNECVYDHDGCLLSSSDKDYPGCAGTPNQYPDTDWVGHTVIDDGGIFNKGGSAILDTIMESFGGERTNPRCCPK